MELGALGRSWPQLLVVLVVLSLSFYSPFIYLFFFLVDFDLIFSFDLPLVVVVQSFLFRVIEACALAIHRLVPKKKKKNKNIYKKKGK
jgi:hypothetical protein